MRSTLREIGYFFKLKPSLHARVRVIMQSTLRGIGYFLKIKTKFTRTRAGNYAFYAEGDWLFFFK